MPPLMSGSVCTGFKETNMLTQMTKRVYSYEPREIRTQWVNVKKKRAKREGIILTHNTGTLCLMLHFLCWQPHLGLRF